MEPEQALAELTLSDRLNTSFANLRGEVSDRAQRDICGEGLATVLRVDLPPTGRRLKQILAGSVGRLSNLPAMVTARRRSAIAAPAANPMGPCDARAHGLVREL